MTVKELIAELEMMPLDMQVAYIDEDGLLRKAVVWQDKSRTGDEFDEGEQVVVIS